MASEYDRELGDILFALMSENGHIALDQANKKISDTEAVAQIVQMAKKYIKLIGELYEKRN